MTGVAFGLNGAPFMANFTVRDHYDMLGPRFPVVIPKLKKNTYVDDAFVGGKTKDEARSHANAARLILLEGSFPTHRWSASSPDLLSDIPVNDKNTSRHVSVLGTSWDTQLDTLTFSFVTQEQLSPHTEHPTKRMLASDTAKLFDASGLISPFIVRGKMLMQDVWKTKIAWDSPLPEPIRTEWLQWRHELDELQDLEIRRNIIPQNTTHTWIAGFGDASNRAYATCIYVIADQKDGPPVRNLVFAKSRVAPTSLDDQCDTPFGIARLELMASLITARAAEYVRTALDLNEVHLFTDSALTFHRIMAGPERWKQWVGARIESILEASDPDQWHFTPNGANSADLPSRGSDVKTLIKSPLWWHGPSFLSKPCSEWPPMKQLTPKEIRQNQEVDALETETNPLPKSRKISSFMSQQSSVVSSFLSQRERTILLWKQDNFPACIRLTAWILRWVLGPTPAIGGCRPGTPSISSFEYQQAERHWVRRAQMETYNREWACFKDKRPLPGNSVIAKLNPFLDERWQIIRLSTRLTLGPDDEYPDGVKNPTLLPKGHLVTELIIHQAHLLEKHGGPEQTLYRLRQTYWLPQGRRTVKYVLSRCKHFRCRRLLTYQEQMSPLPKERLTRISSFLATSTDTFGPLYCVHEDCKYPNCPHDEEPEKHWGIIYVCMYTRAVFLDLIPALNTETILDSFRKFVSSVGWPKYMYSDNAKSYHSSNAEITRLLKQVDKTKIRNFSTQHHCDWHFACPRASHTCGLHERFVGLTKNALAKATESPRVTAHKLRVYLTEAQCCLNQRPLKWQSEDITDSPPITPALLMGGRPLHGFPDDKSPLSAGHDLTKYHLEKKHMLNKFFKRFYKDYLLELSIRKKWTTDNTYPVTKGDVVLVKNENPLKRNEWRLAVLTKPIPGLDEKVRHVALRFAGAKQSTTRPINKIALLESPALELEAARRTTIASLSAEYPSDKLKQPTVSRSRPVIITRPTTNPDTQALSRLPVAARQPQGSGAGHTRHQLRADATPFAPVQAARARLASLQQAGN